MNLDKIKSEAVKWGKRLLGVIGYLILLDLFESTIARTILLLPVFLYFYMTEVK